MVESCNILFVVLKNQGTIEEAYILFYTFFLNRCVLNRKRSSSHTLDSYLLKNEANLDLGRNQHLLELILNRRDMFFLV